MKTFDLTTSITNYELGQISEEDMLELFQYLIDTGLAWTFQGHYGRTATRLIQSGDCHAKYEATKEGHDE